MDNHSRLIDAGARLFSRQGYSATPVEALLQETGVARSNFYYHFDDKLDLARYVVRRWSEAVRDALRGAWQRAEAGEPRLSAAYRVLAGGQSPAGAGQPAGGNGSAPEGGSAGPGPAQQYLNPALTTLALKLAARDDEIRHEVDQLLGWLEDGLEEDLAASPAASGGAGDTRRRARALLAAVGGGAALASAFPEGGWREDVESGLLSLVS